MNDTYPTRAAAVLILLLFITVPLAESPAAQTTPPVSGFFISRLPAGYTAQKTFFLSLRNTGVNTLNRDLTLSDAGFPAIEVISLFRDRGDHRIGPQCGVFGLTPGDRKFG